MTTATLLLALIATPGAAGPPGQPVLLDFHAEWCGPCKQMRGAVAQLVRKGLPVKSIDIDHSPELAERYQVKNLPTFIVVDAGGRALARSMGVMPASDLASLYYQAQRKVPRTAGSNARTQRVEADAETDHPGGEDEPAARDEAPRQAPTNPNPWETVVRIKIDSGRLIGFGSGTIIHSTPEEAIVLTCAHIFKVNGSRQAQPSKFPYKIRVDLFDGQLRGLKPAQVHYANETFDGQVIDYDFSRDVGLIRIRPGRRLPASRVVPASWQPEEKMRMTTVGCSEGHDATAWTTMILKPLQSFDNGFGRYEAVECYFAPKQGRSGGGLYTDDGYVAGVCDFADPRGRGLYATPRSIHHILDRNNLMALYAPATDRPRTILAGNRSRPGRDLNAPALARGQSPEREDADLVTMPSPELLGIRTPAGAEGQGVEAAAALDAQTAWRSTSRPDRAAPAERTDLMIDAAADNDRFATPPAPREAGDADQVPGPATETPTGRGTKWRPVRSPAPGTAGARP